MSSDNGALERLLLKDRAIVTVGLTAVTLLAWSYLFMLVDDMERGDMRAMGMTSMGQAWSPVTFTLMAVMWWVMMVAMMVPSAAPMVLLFARIQRKKLADEEPSLRTTLFATGYLIAWLVFSLAATILQWGLIEVSLLSPMMTSKSQLLGAALFAAAGLYQLTPLKQACLAHCQSPIQFLSTHWRDGNRGALRMGIDHGLYCVGCCWILMALLFAGGVMNLMWVAAIAVFVLLEKLVPLGPWLSRASGGAMLLFAAILLFVA